MKPISKETAMKTLTAMKIAATLTRRVLQITVIGPAVIIGSIAAGLAVFGDDPADLMLQNVYEWADKAVRPAPPNSVLVPQCNEAQQPADIKPSVLCESLTTKPVPAEEAIASARSQLQKLYLLLLAISAGLLVIQHPGRKFLGLPEPVGLPAAPAGNPGLKE